MKLKSPVIRGNKALELETRVFEVDKLLVLKNLKNNERSFHFTKSGVLTFLANNKHITEYVVTTEEIPTNLLY